MAILDFSVSGWHCVTLRLVWNFSFRFHVHVLCGCIGRSLMIFSYVAFKMAALWFWTMFNGNLPIAHCHPLLWGGGILVDHWSTISSCISYHSWTLKCYRLFKFITKKDKNTHTIPSISSGLLMPWHLVSPGHQGIWYWSCNLGSVLVSDDR